MATAQGKIRVDELAGGEHVMLTNDGQGMPIPSPTKVKGAYSAKVEGVQWIEGTGNSFDVITDAGIVRCVAGSRTFYLADIATKVREARAEREGVSGISGIPGQDVSLVRTLEARVAELEAKAEGYKKEIAAWVSQRPAEPKYTLVRTVSGVLHLTTVKDGFICGQRIRRYFVIAQTNSLKPGLGVCPACARQGG